MSLDARKLRKYWFYNIAPPYFQNMFLAIINDTYSEVKAEVNARTESFQVTTYYFFTQGWNSPL